MYEKMSHSLHSIIEGGTKKERRKSYTCHFKLEVVDYAETYTNGKAAEHYSVHRRRVQEWRNQKNKLIDQINQAKGFTKRLSGGGRKNDNRMTLIQLKDKMSSWIKNRLEIGTQIDVDAVYEEAVKYNHNVTMRWADNVFEDVELDILEEGLDKNEAILVDTKQSYSNAEKRAIIFSAFNSKPYTIHDWLDGKTMYNKV